MLWGPGRTGWCVLGTGEAPGTKVGVGSGTDRLFLVSAGSNQQGLEDSSLLESGQEVLTLSSGEVGWEGEQGWSEGTRCWGSGGGVLATGLVQQVQACHVCLLGLQQFLDDPLLRFLQGVWGEKARDSFGLL